MEQEQTDGLGPEQDGPEVADEYGVQGYDSPAYEQARGEALESLSARDAWEEVVDLVDDAQEDRRVIDRLVEEHPAMRSRAAIEAMDPLWRQIAATHGVDKASDPAVIAQLYESLGGDAAFADAAYAEEYEAMLLQGMPTADEQKHNAFTGLGLPREAGPGGVRSAFE